MSNESITPRTQKLWNLTVELEEAKKDKRDVVKAHTENVKRIQAEIKDLLDTPETEPLTRE